MSRVRRAPGNKRLNRKWASSLLTDPDAIQCRTSLLLSKRGNFHVEKK
jgi:hypothetical protein